MKKVLSIFSLISILQAGTAASDPRRDATFLVDTLVSDELIQATLESMRPLLKQAFRAPFESGSNARTLSKEAQNALIEAVYNQFANDFRVEMRQELISIYQGELSADTLAETARFFGTPEGQEFARALPRFTQRGSEAGQIVGSRVGRTVFPIVLRRLVEEGSPVFKPTEIEVFENMLRRDFGESEKRPANK